MSEKKGDTETPAAEASHPAEEDSRRAFLLTLGIGGLGVGLAAVIAPAAPYVLYPLEHETIAGGTGFVPVGKLTRFKEGVPQKVDLFSDKKDAWNRVLDVKVGSVWVVKLGAKVQALSTVCPHLGCAVDYDAPAKKFKCPCHRSAFSLDGTVQGGPSPRPMDALETKTKDNLLSVRYERFKQGVKAKERV